MLPRVSAALAQFIAPIAASGKQSTGAKQGFERFNPDKKRNPGKQQSSQDPPAQQGQSQAPPQGATVIPFPKKAEPPPPPKTGGASALPSGVSQALLHLMHLMKDQRALLMRWLGPSSYQTAARQQKKNGRVRKGTILDERAE